MDRTEYITKRLRAQGVRLTRQRRTIVAAALARHGHFSVEQIAADVAQHDPAIDLATVYRTLHRLVEVGAVRPLQGACERLQFEVAAVQCHHHLICSVCGAEQQINAALGEVLRAFVRERYGFIAETEHLGIRGRCAQCSSTEEQAR
jgi:Fur family ferric uptake transcriptional regulator